MRRSTMSALTALLRDADAARIESAASGIPIDEVTDMRAQRRAVMRETRRAFLRKTLSAAAAATAALSIPRRSSGAAAQRVVIVGGGLAGLRCAHKLWVDHGIASSVYEWDDHVGGRVETLRNYFANGQIVEMHGEFISSEHTSMLALAARFGLGLDNTNVYPKHTSDTYWFLGGRYTQAQLNCDWRSFGWGLFQDAIKAAPWRQTPAKHTPAGYDYDHMSVIDWIDRYVPNGMNSPFGKLCAADAEGEYGSPAHIESALNLIYLLGYDSSRSGNGLQPERSPVLAGTDEKWHITGGNDQIITGMVNELPAGTIKLGQQLVAAVKNSDGTLVCTFTNGSATTTACADALVLAIPFSTLRQVDLSKAGISSLKRTAINHLGYGTNAKVLLQFNSRPWNTDGHTGNSLEDTLAAQNWETTNYQPGPQGIMLSFPGGLAGRNLASKYGIVSPNDEGPAPALMASDFLASLEQIFPGCTAAYNGLAYYNIGVIDPHILGAWANYLIGQYTLFSGVEPLREGNIHFCGEHTSMDFQGFMEGAVRSGERVAREIY